MCIYYVNIVKYILIVYLIKVSLLFTEELMSGEIRVNNIEADL